MPIPREKFNDGWTVVEKGRRRFKIDDILCINDEAPAHEDLARAVC